jgi:hypothetical protein
MKSSMAAARTAMTVIGGQNYSGIRTIIDVMPWIRLE